MTQGRGPAPGAPTLMSERGMNAVALVAVVLVGLAVAFSYFSTTEARSLPNDAIDEAIAIKALPFRDDGVALAAAAAAPDDPQPSCVSPSHAAWYTLQPATDVPLSAWVVPDREEADVLDVALAVWRREADGSLAEVGCVDERGTGAPEQLVFSATVPGPYLFQVVTADQLDDEAGTLTFVLDEQRPEHDLFAFARWVDDTPYRDADVDASGARREPGEVDASCADMEATTWYGISAPADTVLSTTVAPSDATGDPMDVAVALHTGGSVGSLVEMACVDAEGSGGREHLQVPLNGGEVYWIEVGAVLDGGTGPGSYSLAIDGMQTIDLAPMPDTVFGAEPLQVVAEASSGLPVAVTVDGPCRVRAGSLSVLGAGLCTITASQVGDDDWAPARSVTTTLRIGRGPQSIAVEPIGEAVVGASTPIRASAGSDLPVMLEAAGSCAIEEGRLVASAAGPCTVTASQPGDDDWAPARPVVRTVQVGRGPQSLQVEPLAPLTVGQTAQVRAESSAGLLVVIAAEGACRARGGSVVGTGAGPCTVTASQPGDDDWAPAEPVTRTLRIGRGAQALELGPTPDTVLGAEPLAISAEAGSGLPVALAVEGPCRLRDGKLLTSGAGTCVLTASQPGDVDWAPAEPLVRRITIAPAAQTVELGAIADQLLGADPVSLLASATSGLPVDFDTSGPCHVAAGTLVLDEGGRCTVTATQPGNTDWAPAQASSSLRIVAPITDGRPAFTSPDALSLPGVLVGAGAEVSSVFEPGSPRERFFAIALDEGDQLQVGDIEPITSWSVATPSSLRRGTPRWEVLEPSDDATDALWLATESGLHALRVMVPTLAPDEEQAYTLRVEVDPGQEAWQQAQADLVERTRSMPCTPIGEGDPRPLANGALAGVECEEPAEGVSELKLFTFPNTYQLRTFHRQRSDTDGRVRPDPSACEAGRPGVRKWEHGQIACWLPRDRSKAVVHWTDERTDTYGIIRALAGQERQLDKLWQTVLEEMGE